MDPMIQSISKYQRPVGSFLALALLFVGVFVPSVTADKLWVLAGLSGLYWAARSIDKRLPPDAPKPPGGDMP
jgi:hypothetical protein